MYNATGGRVLVILLNVSQVARTVNFLLDKRASWWHNLFRGGWILWIGVIAMSEQGYELYAPSINTARKAADKIVNSAIDTDRVVEAIIHALTAKKAKTRYIVGRHAKLAAIASSLLSDRLRDSYICRAMGLIRSNMGEVKKQEAV